MIQCVWMPLEALEIVLPRNLNLLRVSAFFLSQSVAVQCGAVQCSPCSCCCRVHARSVRSSSFPFVRFRWWLSRPGEPRSAAQRSQSSPSGSAQRPSRRSTRPDVDASPVDSTRRSLRTRCCCCSLLSTGARQCATTSKPEGRRERSRAAQSRAVRRTPPASRTTPMCGQAMDVPHSRTDGDAHIEVAGSLSAATPTGSRSFALGDRGVARGSIRFAAGRDRWFTPRCRCMRNQSHC